MTLNRRDALGKLAAGGALAFVPLAGAGCNDSLRRDVPAGKPGRGIITLATMKARPGKEATARTTLLGLIEPTRKEKDCISYVLHEATKTPGQFMFYENWTSQAALDAHLARPHMTEFLGKTDELFENLDVTVYDVLA